MKEKKRLRIKFTDAGYLYPLSSVSRRLTTSDGADFKFKEVGSDESQLLNLLYLGVHGQSRSG